MRRSASVTHMGLDIHRNFSQVSACGQEGQLLWRARLEHADRTALRAELAKWPKVPVVLEGSFGWGWISDELLAVGAQPHLSSSRKVAAWRLARGIAKSNRTDADLLGDLWLEKKKWWEVWRAPADVRDQREWLRYRMGLVQMQTQIKNRIHATLHRHGVVSRHSDLFGVAGRRWLSLLIGEECSQSLLRHSGRQTLKAHLILLDQVRRHIAQATRELRGQIKTLPAARRLMTLAGISWILAYTIVAEIGRIERFAGGRSLCTYSLLAPQAEDSGDETDQAPIGRRIGHAGRRTLKWAWIEAAHTAVRKGGRFKSIFDRRSDNGKRDRGRAYIAVAHDLCRIGYALWKNDVDYSDCPPPRPGSRSEPSRPGTGQPEHPMVPALAASAGRQASS